MRVPSSSEPSSPSPQSSSNFTSLPGVMLEVIKPSLPKDKSDGVHNATKEPLHLF